MALVKIFGFSLVLGSALAGVAHHAHYDAHQPHHHHYADPHHHHHHGHHHHHVGYAGVSPVLVAKDAHKLLAKGVQAVAVPNHHHHYADPHYHHHGHQHAHVHAPLVTHAVPTFYAGSHERHPNQGLGFHGHHHHHALLAKVEKPNVYSKSIPAAAIRNVETVMVTKTITPVVTKTTTRHLHAEPALSLGHVQGYSQAAVGHPKIAPIQFNTAYTAYANPTIGINGPVVYSGPAVNYAPAAVAAPVGKAVVAAVSQHHHGHAHAHGAYAVYPAVGYEIDGHGNYLDLNGKGVHAASPVYAHGGHHSYLH